MALYIQWSAPVRLPSTIPSLLFISHVGQETVTSIKQEEDAPVGAMLQALRFYPLMSVFKLVNRLLGTFQTLVDFLDSQHRHTSRLVSLLSSPVRTLLQHALSLGRGGI